MTTSTDFGRDYTLQVCADGTMSYRVTRDSTRDPRWAGNDPRRRRNAQRSALPVFAVNTEAQAQAAIVRYCILRYDQSHRWTDWPTDLDPNDGKRGVALLDKITDELRDWFAEQYPGDGQHREASIRA